MVNLSEKTRKHCILLENSSYEQFAMITLNMVQQGIFGEVISYTTHSLGPARQVLDIHRGDRLKTLVVMGTNSIDRNTLEREYTVALIRTENGKVIEIRHNYLISQLHNRLQQLTGTKGFTNKYPYENYAFNSVRLSSSVVQPNDSLSIHELLSDDEWNVLVSKYQHPILKKYGEIAKKTGIHSSVDFIMDSRLVYCLQNGLPLDMDVYDLAEWYCLTELGLLSMEHNSVPVSVPDFTRGEWNMANGFKHAYATLEDETVSLGKAKAFTARQKIQGNGEWSVE